MLGLKQKEQNDNFVRTEQNIKSIVSKAELDNLIDVTVEKMKPVLNGNKWGVAWSGGKDSVALEFVCDQIGKYPSCMGMTDDLEYPEFLKFVTDNMPDDLVVYNSGHNLKWLAANLDWLFPDNSQKAAKWFKAIQHKAQNNFFKYKGLDLLLTGRRKKDANYVGKNGIYKNKATGVVRYSPIYDWSHEMVIAAMKYYNLKRAPFYNWNNGWVVGSGCWAARQWTGSVDKAWHEVWQIDSSVVKRASKYIKSASDYVRDLGV
tara:strand:- start:15485 stop:16267 length:783 start_codon:yes stop_codon:yes gene_type:complete